LNMFGKAFVSLPVQHYKHMNLHLHVCGDENDHRGGAKGDACYIISFILCHHRTETSDRLAPVLIEEFLPSPVAQQAYDIWCARIGTHLTPIQQEMIKKNTLQRQGEIALQQRQEAVLMKQQKQLLGGGDHRPSTIPHTSSGPVDADLDDDDHDNSDRQDHDADHHHRPSTKQVDQDGFYVDHDDPQDRDLDQDDQLDDDDDDIDELDVMAAIRKRQKTIRKEMIAEGGHRGTIHAVRWSDSRLAREIAVRERTLNMNNNTTATTSTTTTNTVRDSADAIQEIQAREDEKAKILGKDPLGIHHSITDIAPNANISSNINNNNEDYFDLRYFEVRQAEQIEMALQEIQEDIMKAEAMLAQQHQQSNNMADDIYKKHLLQKQSLEQLVESLGGLERLENTATITSTSNKNSKSAISNSTTNNNNNSNYKASILPTSPTFHPLFFLTILHRKTQYKDLLASMERLHGKIFTLIIYI
jgi:hypothetical protein